MGEYPFPKPTASKLPSGCNSTRGLGAIGPEPRDSVTLPDGVVVPLGRICRRSLPGGTLQHNEYVVYNPAQARTRFLVEVQLVGKTTPRPVAPRAVPVHATGNSTPAADTT